MANGSVSFTNMAAYNAYSNLFNPWRNCFPSVNGSFYNSTGAYGQYINSTTNSSNTYGCIYPFIFNGAAKMTEALISLFVVAFTTLYLSQWWLIKYITFI